jgi:dolichol-phosphate mannosyltransferase
MMNNTDAPSIVVVIPTLNEEWGLRPTINEINTYLEKPLILVVDGRSIDSTIKVAKELGAKVVFQTGLGKGDAIATALEHLKDKKFEYLVLIDADFTYPAVYFDRMVEILEKNPKVGMVCGNRFDEKLIFWGFSIKYHFGNKMLSFFHKLLNNVHMNDPLTGLRLIRWSILND